MYAKNNSQLRIFHNIVKWFQHISVSKCMYIFPWLWTCCALSEDTDTIHTQVQDFPSRYLSALNTYSRCTAEEQYSFGSC